MVIIEGMEHVTETEKDSILNNLGTLISSARGTIPLLRAAGVHMPVEDSRYQRNKYATEIMEQAENYEDRAEVTDVTFTDMEGNVKVVVEYGNE